MIIVDAEKMLIGYCCFYIAALFVSGRDIARDSVALLLFR